MFPTERCLATPWIRTSIRQRILLVMLKAKASAMDFLIGVASSWKYELGVGLVYCFHLPTKFNPTLHPAPPYN